MKLILFASVLFQRMRLQRLPWDSKKLCFCAGSSKTAMAAPKQRCQNGASENALAAPKWRCLKNVKIALLNRAAFELL